MFDHFSIAAPLYDKIIRIYDHERICRLLRLPANVRLLDAGGGTGRISRRLYPLSRQVVICDLSQAMLRQAADKGGLNPVRAHAERLPFDDDRFDRILVVDALHHFCSQKEALTDLVRVLKPGGSLVIEEPDVTRPIVKLVALMERLALMGSRFLTSLHIVRILNDLGMVTHVENDGRFIFWVQAYKPK
jgi:demethylmenaquinone methyltransferase/2-methoxy-6-polyprenyl-1,4-benzoquinol methylase